MAFELTPGVIGRSQGRVLVVEDQPAVQEVVVELLEATGFDVMLASSIEQASGFLGAVDVVVLDLHLPDGSGLELLRRVHRRADAPEVVVTTGHGTVDNALEALDQGAFSFLLKPVTPDNLISTVERAVKRRRERGDLSLHREILQAVHDLVIGVDGDGRVVYVNAAAMSVLGADAAALAGRQLIDGLPHAQMTEGDFRVGRPDGGTVWLRGRWTKAGVRGIDRLLVAQDMTRERRIERDLLRSGTLAGLGMSLAEAAHDFSHPATWLGNNLAVLSLDMSSGQIDAAEGAALVRECQDGLRRMVEIMGRLRDMARAEVAEDSAPLDLGRVVADALRIARGRLGDAVVVQLVQDQPLLVTGSAGRLVQLFTNLVVNAGLALSDQRAPVPRVRVTLICEDALAVVTVDDNGPGVADGLRNGLFEPFVTTRGDGGGLGLGLSLCRTIARDHGGSVEHVPKSARGALFKVCLPRL